MKSLKTIILSCVLAALIVNCDRDRLPTGVESDAGTGRLVIMLVKDSQNVSTSTQKANSLSVAVEKSKAEGSAQLAAVSSLLVRVLDSSGGEITINPNTFTPQNGYFDATIEVKAQSGLTVLCIGRNSAGAVERFVMAMGVKVVAGRNDTVSISESAWTAGFVPQLNSISPNPSTTGSYQVSWGSVNGADSYLLQEAANSGFSGAVTAYSGGSTYTTISGKAPGTTYYYRVQATNSRNVAGAWSNSQSVTVTQAPSAEITMLSIPGGTFQMGSTTGFSDEQPVHTDTVSALQMSKYEITQAHYQAVMGTNPSWFTGDDNRPVERVSWYDAVTFCNKLSELAGLQPCYNLSTWSCDFTKNGYRLPTEAEWEYACRAGTTTNYYTGDNESDLDRAGWYSGNSGSTTHAVGGKLANACGLYDMHGNVWEWCHEWYGSYGSASQTNPTGPSSGSDRIIRGGSWFSLAYYCRSASRNSDLPDFRSSVIGFRVVRR